MVSKQQKTSPISINQKIDYKDIDLLTLFVTEQGKILPRRYGCNCSTTTKISKSDQKSKSISIISFCCIELCLKLFRVIIFNI
jgi:small subunit ribosomal protein S18